MTQSPRFKEPLKYKDIEVEKINGLILPGGHAPGMKPYLESEILQGKVREFFDFKKPVGAICHGTIVLARTKDLSTNKSVISDYKTTSLLKLQELSAYYLTRHKLGNYYRTYPQTVQDEVVSALNRSNDFKKGNIPILRDSAHHVNRGFIVRDKNYLSARCPGDAYRFSMEFLKMLQESKK